ncbi:Phosphoribosylamine--glycine ligase [Planctomycetales bacterium 10988]|nr:Phosphoribosylamine--glycine ligase [Planctomycetales bacterium 10988]
MKILIVGNGGREHALAWKIAQSPRADRVFVAPGNAGTHTEPGVENVDIPAMDFDRLIKFAKQEAIDLTVVGPEAPLAAGIVDAFQAEKLKVFGPTKAAAELEGSKVFCKNLLRHADVPTADFKVFRKSEDALHYVNHREETPLVIKASGLAAGKGVIVCQNRVEAREAVQQIMDDRAFGEAGDQLVVEECLRGQELSVLAITDGRTILPLEPAQDHKPAYEGDQGPNTGGMGAYTPVPQFSDDLLDKVESDILVPVVHAMKRQRRPFRGILYAGLMLTQQGPKVLEFNVRFGDPECQPLLMRLKTDLVDLFEAVVDQRLDEIGPLEWDPRPSVCVVMASEGYPGEYKKGHPIRGLDEAAEVPQVKVFHAGTAISNDLVVNNGGRVLGVTALGDSLPSAKLQAYRAVKMIRWPGAWCRKDISDKALSDS